MMLIVLDTDVLVSALLKRHSIPGKILDAILAGKLQIAIDERIRQEYEAVLSRPRFNIPFQQSDAALRFLSQTALWVDVHKVDFPQDLVLDPSDLPFAEVAICGDVEALVTGNLKHFMFLQGYPVKVLLPRAFFDTYAHFL
jgi:uncharacterized protein